MNQYEQDLRTQAENKKKKDDMIEKGLLLGGAILGGIALYNAHVNNAPKETLDNLFDNKLSPNPIESGDNTIVPPVVEPSLETTDVPVVDTPIVETPTTDAGTEQLQEIQINEATRGKVLPYHDVWTREMVENDPNNYYVFGDNTDDRLNTHYVPSQTQAVIRGLPNAIGVDTKLNRGIADSSYLTDDYARSEAYKNHLKDVERQILKAISEGHNVYLPYTGGKGLALGNGKAQLPKRAPEAYKMLKELASRLLLKYR